ncbi:hypothetical protein GCM10010302_66680 [Streptomyces polychromogenes]|uniref:DUF4232 domain-containing protein n=1 Tax=Streptomyces polychromogenes TaxID=67342 RepID=A0ABN0VVS5_9ACTN
MADDLSSALRELADSAAAPAPTTGAEVRRRAVSRRRRRHSAVAAGTVAVVAALAFGLTTVLGGPESHRRPAPPPAASLAAPTADAASPAAPTAGVPSPTTPSPSAPTLAGPTPTAPAAPTAPASGVASSVAPASVAGCAVADLGFSVTSEDGKGEPVRHLLLTVTNTGKRKCGLYGYPYLKFPYARAPIAVIEDSQDAPAVLAPGEKAYAALLAHGGRMDTYDTDSLPVGLQGPGPGGKPGEPGEPVNVTLPGQVAFDDEARVTYWITAPGLALRFIMSS